MLAILIMIAAVCKRYGPPEVLQIQEVTKPICKDNEILVKILAASVNSGDVRVRGLAVSGILKVIMRFVLGFFGPRYSVLGIVFAGVVEEKGDKTNRFAIGEKVFGITGFKFGTHAQYVSVRESSIMTEMPVNATFEEAASLPFGWHTAIYFLKKAGIESRKRPKVLIYGATGSVGLAAIQLAQYFDSELTAVCSSRGSEAMMFLSVNDVIYYDLHDFTQTSQTFDIIFDAVGKTSKSFCKHLLEKGGTFVTVAGLDTATPEIAHLDLIRQLWEAGMCRAIIDRVYPLTEIVAAHAYVDTGRKKGDVVLTIHHTENWNSEMSV
jgi:NADPH:quinone reductase-like Zn-dependent oxidoreductase